MAKLRSLWLRFSVKSGRRLDVPRQETGSETSFSPSPRNAAKNTQFKGPLLSGVSASPNVAIVWTERDFAEPSASSSNERP